MVCKNCGNQMPNGTRFCGKCGYQTEEVSKKTYCPNCGAEMDSSSGVCPKCKKPKVESVPDDFDAAAHKKRGLIPVLAAAVVVVIAVLSIVVGYTLYGGMSDDDVSVEDATAEATTAEPTDSPAESTVEIIGKIDATPTPVPTPTPAPTPTPNTTVAATYYVANCSEYVTLRKSPSTSAAELAKVHLGQTVGYIEDAGNGFSKVNYNGTIGYILTKYLSVDRPLQNTGNSASDTNSTQAAAYSAPKFTYATASSVRSNMQDSSGNTVNYSPNNVLDGKTSTCWAMDITSGVEPSITLYANEKQNVSGIKFSNGYFKSQHLYDANRKITKIEVLYEGGSKVYSCSSSQFMVLQDVKFDSAVNSSYITINILESTDATYNDICISTIEVY